jgi:hypothetical protein
VAPLPTLDDGLRLGDELCSILHILEEPGLRLRSDLARWHAGELNPTLPADFRFHFLAGSTLRFDPYRYAHTFGLPLGLALTTR